MRFHLIDRIDDYEPEQFIRARKLTSFTETFWRDGAMPEPLILEALCQAGTWLVLVGSERRRRAALLSVGSVLFGGAVRPGDVLEIEATVSSIGEQTAVISGRVSVGDTIVLEAEDVMCALIDATELDDLERTELMQRQLTARMHERLAAQRAERVA
jgi:3-hydroxyacyl-[acyl-carrier-protein] dehydratase